MENRLLLLVAGLVALSIGITDSPAFADSEAPPSSYKKVTPGEKYVFVMLPRETVEQEIRRWNEENQSRIREIRRTYKQSGLYRNDGSADPLWTVDWFAYGVDVASDGIHLVRRGRWALAPEDHNAPLGGAALDQEAVSFFANGRLLRTYKIGELVTNPARLHRSWSHFVWQEEGLFDDQRLEYRLATLDGNRFVIDVRTGEITTDSRVATGRGVGAGATSLGPVILWGAAIVFGVSLMSLFVWMVVMRRKAARRRLRFDEVFRRKGGGPHDIIDPHTGAIVTKRNEQ
jgi:hypothetical protein